LSSQNQPDAIFRESARDKTYKASSFTALAWTWFTFWEGWLFGHFLGWAWAVGWFGGWVLGRALYEMGRRAKA